MTRRTIVKWLHWLAFFLILYFFFAEPEVEDGPLLQRSDELSTHAGMGMVLGVASLITVLAVMNATVLSGALAGLASEYPVLGFGIVPLNPAGWGTEGLHDAMEEVHEIVFNLTTLERRDIPVPRRGYGDQAT